VFKNNYIFNITNIVFKRRQFNVVFLNYIFYFVCGFKNISVIKNFFKLKYARGQLLIFYKIADLYFYRIYALYYSIDENKNA
jgi:hypothetical protein